MSAIAAALAAILALAECGIQTSPFGVSDDPDLGACNGGPM